MSLVIPKFRDPHCPVTESKKCAILNRLENANTVLCVAGPRCILSLPPSRLSLYE